VTWKVVVRPQADNDILTAAAWYDAQYQGLGNQFIEETLKVFDALQINPLLHCQRDFEKNIRWRYPGHFPYRVVYQVNEPGRAVIIISVLHSSRHDREWRKRS
jgi:mRNA-degrading endonuclease RelE of RelBE toxin-antitoxin system